MLLGVLGPANGDLDGLSKAALFLRDELRVDRALYLGVDTALDTLVHEWAQEIVGENPREDAVWRRAAERCADASAATIDSFLEVERRRRELQLFESLHGDGTRDVELLNGKVVLLIHDKAHLDEEDILAASVLVFGKSRQPVVRQVGQRWFLSPGDFSHGGALTLEDREDGIHVSLYDRDAALLKQQKLDMGRAARMRVQGASGG